MTGYELPPRGQEGTPSIAPAVLAEIERLRRHAVGCSSCSTCESMGVFSVLVEMVEGHAGNHTCDTGAPRLTWGTRLPYGPNCPRLCRIAEQLGVTTE